MSTYRTRLGAATMFSSCFLFTYPAIASSDEHFLFSQELLFELCDAENSSDIGSDRGLRLRESTDVVIRGRNMGWEAIFTSADGNDYRAQRLAPGNRFRGARLEWWQRDQPQLLLSVGANCRLQMARRMVFDEMDTPLAVAQLDQELKDTGVMEMLNPPVPAGVPNNGVKVALVDAGVNYQLPIINEQLARDKNGRILGYDYWDLDRKPFDSNPARSPFFPQRHGTRTASLLLREAPGVLLVPYRYPRPDMTRMAELLADIDRNDVKVVGIPMGGARRSEWEVFADIASTMENTLFIVSAGNGGTNIDFTSVYPASLELQNMLVVTSADDSAQPAQGSNWGRRSVDLLLPAEHQSVIDFGGEETIVSGSSYAVSRTAALAMRLLSENPLWGGPELKSAIFARALREPYSDFVSVGYIPDPLAKSKEVSVLRISKGDSYSANENGSLSLDLHIGLLDDSGWAESDLTELVTTVGHVLGQCGIDVLSVHRYLLKVSPRLLDFAIATSHTLVAQARLPTPAVFLVRDTKRVPAFEGEAFGQANTHYRHWLRDTVWLTAGISEPGVGLAHELVHVLSNSGEHSLVSGNLMQQTTSVGATALDEEQCQLLRMNGVTTGLIQQIQ